MKNIKSGFRDSVLIIGTLVAARVLIIVEIVPVGLKSKKHHRYDWLWKILSLPSPNNNK